MNEWFSTLGGVSLNQLLELMAVIVALAYVLLAARQNQWCWPNAFLSTAIYTWLFWQVTLPFQAGLNAYYMLAAVYGWWRWNKVKDQDISIVSWSSLQQLKWLAVVTLVAWTLSVGFTNLFDHQYLYLDVFITVFSLFATLLTVYKVLESWLYWVFIDIAAVYLYWQKDMQLTALLFALYTLLAIYGYWQWRRTMISPSAVVVKQESVEC